GATSAAEVLAEVESVALDNGAVVERCEVVAAEYALTPSEANVLGNCADLGGVLSDAVYKRTAGVKVTVSDTRSVPFAAFVDSEEITGRATAAATAQPIGEGRSPFMLCAEQGVHPVDPLQPDATHPLGW